MTTFEPGGTQCSRSVSTPPPTCVRISEAVPAISLDAADVRLYRENRIQLLTFGCHGNQKKVSVNRNDR